MKTLNITTGNADEVTAAIPSAFVEVTLAIDTRPAAGDEYFVIVRLPTGFRQKRFTIKSEAVDYADKLQAHLNTLLYHAVTFAL